MNAPLKAVAVLGVALALVGCIALPKPSLSPAELDRIQRKEFNASSEQVLNAARNVLREKGYQITKNDREQGIIVAVDHANASETAIRILALDWKRLTQVEATLNVTPLGDKRASARLVLSRKTSAETRGRQGELRRTINDEKLYETIFRRLDARLNEAPATPRPRPASKARNPSS